MAASGRSTGPQGNTCVRKSPVLRAARRDTRSCVMLGAATLPIPSAERASRPMKYRKDIDGLRAVAVLAVVLFHAKVPGFAGGFVGVDVFFVISGYLITGLIADDCRQGRFTFATFYFRRIRRIVPALLCVYVACTLAAALLMLPSDMAEFARSLVSSAAFVSNHFFYHLAGYFGGQSDLKPLLHTWSLSIEEQFYLSGRCCSWSSHAGDADGCHIWSGPRERSRSPHRSSWSDNRRKRHSSWLPSGPGSSARRRAGTVDATTGDGCLEGRALRWLRVADDPRLCPAAG